MSAPCFCCGQPTTGGYISALRPVRFDWCGSVACEMNIEGTTAVHGPGNLPFDFAAFIDAKAEWSRETFGPQSITGLRKHIDKELAEIDRDPTDLIEWVDLVLLALDGATKHAGATGAEFVAALVAKMAANRERRWPDWRALGPDEAREHVRDGEP